LEGLLGSQKFSPHGSHGDEVRAVAEEMSPMKTLLLPQDIVVLSDWAWTQSEKAIMAVMKV
jgi:hypothetical protein